MEMPRLDELARDEAANTWAENNVPFEILEQLRAWCRGLLAEHDEDDQAELGVLLLDIAQYPMNVPGKSARGYAYCLIMSWAEPDREQRAFRSMLRVNDANEIVEFITIDKD